MSEKTLQQKIREMGELVHTDPEINQDDLPVYFKLRAAGDYYLIVDMVKKDEIGVVSPDNVYKVLNQIVAELVFEMAVEHHKLKEELRNAKKPGGSLPDPWPDIPWNDGEFYKITCAPNVYVMEPDPEIPPGTPMMEGKDE